MVATRVLVLSEIEGVLEALQAACSASDATFTLRSVASVSSGELRNAQVVVADPVTFAARVHEAPGLKWLQSTYAGPDSLITKSNARHYTVTRLAGVFGPSMAEYVMLQVLAQERQYLENAKRQSRKEWGMRGAVAQKSYRLLSTLRLGVLGPGDIGKEVVKRASQFGMTVSVCKRDTSTPMPDGASAVYGTAELPAFLAELDFLVNLLPSTEQTQGLLTKGALLACKGAVFINVGRGDITSESSIITALEVGALRHAVLDVFPEEPLPATSPLWDHPGVTITPHNSAESFPEDVAKAFAANLKSYRAGKPLDHIFSWDKGY